MTDPSLPALLGGTPVCPQGPPDWPPHDPDILQALHAAHADGSWGRYHGGHVADLEHRLADYHGSAHALTCASGTLAVELALRALGVGPGQEVLVAGYDYGGNFLSVHAVGARPVLLNVAADNWNLAADRLAEAAGPTARVLIASHLHGGLVPMRSVTAAASALGLRVVEDAAQAAGATVQGRRAGTWGDVGVLSFGGSKLLSAGRGGALLTPHADVHQRLRLLLQRGNQHWAALSELQALVLRPQLDKLDARTARRAAAVRTLTAALADVPGLTPFANGDTDGTPAYYKLGFQYDAVAFGLPRPRFVAALRAEGVAFDEGFQAAHVGRAEGRFRRGGSLDEAERAHLGVVVLHHPVLLGDAAALGEVAAAVRKTYLNSHSLG